MEIELEFQAELCHADLAEVGPAINGAELLVESRESDTKRE